MSEKIYSCPDNYIYAYHTNKFYCLPVFPDNIQDSMAVQFTPTTPLARSAPIYSYSNSGPRTISFSIEIHRDFMNQVNTNNSEIIPKADDDYLDSFIDAIHSLSVPEYTDAQKMVNPPLAALKIGNQIFCKGIISNLNLEYKLPLIELSDGRLKYAVASLSFTMNEFDAYDAEYLRQVGSYRGMNNSLERRVKSITQGQGALEILDQTKIYTGGGTSGGGRRNISFAEITGRDARM